jgi:hypothetical protein
VLRDLDASMRPVLVILVFVVALTACTSHPPPHQPGDCNPLGATGACYVPWPSSYFQVDDSASATGMRNAVPLAAMPKNIDKKPIDPSRINRLDGFSPATPVLLYLPGVDITGLATVHDFTPSTSPDAKIQLFDMSTGDRIEYFAELDAHADPTMMQRQGLIVRPQTRLKPATKYAVAVIGLGTAPDAFVEVRDGQLTTDSALYDMQDRYNTLFTFLEKQGLKRGDLTLAWDFTTSSEDMITGRLTRMRDKALAASTFAYRIDSVQDFSDAGLAQPLADGGFTDGGLTLREIFGTFVSQRFLASDGGTAVLPADAGADPAIISADEYPFVATIPACAATAPLPIPMMIYGHGFLGSAQKGLEDPTVAAIANKLCMVQVATNWIGLSSSDLGTIGGTVVEDLGRFDIITDRLMQAQVNTHVLTRMAKTKLKDDDALKLNGTPVTDASQLYYLGISLGGIEGTTFMALNPDITRAVTNVPGGEWSFIMTRSNDFSTVAVLFDTFLPDRLDQQLALAYSQSLWDETDPISYAPHLLKDPIGGVSAKKILVQESEGDSQVPNLTTRLLARTEGQIGLSPLVTSVPGITEMPAPLDSAYVQFDTHPMPLPGDQNLPPDQNGAHDACHQLEVAIKQMGAFLKPDGSVQQFCSGTCDPD